MSRIVIIAIIVAAGVVGWLYWSQTRPQPLIVSGFVEADEIRVGSRVGGRVSEVTAAEGQTLKAGDVIYRIDPFDLREMLAQAEAQKAANQAELARLKAGYRREEIEQARAKRDQAAATLEKLLAGPRKEETAMARARLSGARATLELAKSEYDRVMKLAKESTTMPIEIDRVTKALKAAQADVEASTQDVAMMEEGSRKEDIANARAAKADAEAALALVEAGYRKEDVAKAEAQVAAAAANVAAIKLRLDELTVTAPTLCEVEAIDLRPGDLVAANGPSVSLVDLSRKWVRAYVPESRLGEVKLGQRVPIRVDSFPGKRFMSHIEFIATEAEFTPRNVQTPEERSKQVFRIKAMLDEGRDQLRIGMAADVMLGEATPHHD